MKFPALLLLAALAAPAAAKPVHIALNPAPAVSPDADGFFTLGAVATVTGGDLALRTRLSGILVGRAPLSGETRHLTRGDLALKLRQAGCDPDKAAVVEGAESADVTTGAAPPAPEQLHPTNNGGAGGEPEKAAAISVSAPPLSTVVGAGGTLIHRGDAVTIVIQSGPMKITAPGTARENGLAGQTIRVHRDGVMTDLSVQVLDAQTVGMEI